MTEILTPSPHDAADEAAPVQPYVQRTLTHKALHFSIHEIQSSMDVRAPHALDLDYTRTMMAFLLFLQQPRHILMIGLGGGSLAKFCHHHLPRTVITAVEINPHVVALRDEFLIPPDGSRFKVIVGDGARHLRDDPEVCDVLMVDGFDDQGQPEALCTQAFYDLARERLRPGGMLVVNLHYGHPEHRRHVARIRRAFGGQALVVDDAECCNTVVFACKGERLTGVRRDDLRPARSLRRDARGQLAEAFALVTDAWTQQIGSAPATP
ncbi:fused MFS/spermidine synthase [Pseudaquabacterium rugosum]|uniref:Fused MFS/spermidine synthase n=1 Tax=Pseudaquabacterium rugosum TaxID=2984194 RepID=A0ABU9B6U9_9BURK